MPISKLEFSRLYSRSKKELVGTEASPAELDDNYRYYVAIADLCRKEGQLLFRLDPDHSLTWEFAPHY